MPEFQLVMWGGQWSHCHLTPIPLLLGPSPQLTFGKPSFSYLQSRSLRWGSMSSSSDFTVTHRKPVKMLSSLCHSDCSGMNPIPSFILVTMKTGSMIRVWHEFAHSSWIHGITQTLPGRDVPGLFKERMWSWNFCSQLNSTRWQPSKQDISVD